MDNYEIFKGMLHLVGHNATVTDANMSYLGFYDDRKVMRVIGEREDEVIEVEVTIKKKEVQENAETLE